MLASELDFQHLNSKYLENGRWNSISTYFQRHIFEQSTSLLPVALMVFASLAFMLSCLTTYNDGLPVVNRLFPFEPRVFARFRWAIKSKSILEYANNKASGPGSLEEMKIDQV